MLFETEDQVLPSDLLEKLRTRAKEISAVLSETKNENMRLKEELLAMTTERDKLKDYIGRYEEERTQLKTIVDELLKEFEQV